jgi:prepilin-type N-terminal cleavage/methylation domain-containing protein
MYFLKNKGKINYKSGVTLMELLVVTALIGILSSTIYVSFNTIKMRARDNQRISDLNNINLAIRMYMQFNNNKPPYSGTPWFAQANNICYLYWNNLVSKLVPNYMSKIPDDPKSPGFDSGTACVQADGYWYYYAANKKFNGTNLVVGGDYDYAICSKMEKTTNFPPFTSPWNHPLNYCVGS